MEPFQEGRNEYVQETKVSTDELQRTLPPQEQEWCAYTYLLLPAPQENVHGVIKILCTGRSEEHVRSTIQAMFDSGQLEAGLPFVRIRPTGRWHYIIPGNDPRAEVNAYNTDNKEFVTGAESQITGKRKQQAKDVRMRMKQLEREAKDQSEEDPKSYEVYAHLRVKEQSIKSWLKIEEKAVAEQKQHLVEANRRRIALEREMPAYKRQFEKELSINKAEEALDDEGAK